MSARTFYIAAASAGGLECVRACAADLERLGLRWAFDWTPHVGCAVLHWGIMAATDLRAVEQAHLFVALLDGPVSRGAWAELGARLMTGAHAHVVMLAPPDGGSDDHAFLHHPRVIRHRTWPAFVETAAEYATPRDGVPRS